MEIEYLEYCDKCKEPIKCRDLKYGTIINLTCKCDKNKRVQAETERAELYRRERIERNREVAFCGDKRLLTYTFANDDGTNEKLLTLSKNYVDRFDELAQKGKGLLFYGGVGVGKTFYAGCISNALIDKGYTVIFTNFASVANAMYGGDKQAQLDRLIKCDLLVLDDLAAERDTEYMGELIQLVIDKRYMNNKPIIVTTNLTAKELREPQGIRRQRVYSRLFEMCVPFEIEGEDKRREKLVAEYADLKKMLGV